MKIIFLILICAALFSACEKSAPEVRNVEVKPTPVTEPSMPQNKNYDGKGVVTKINLKQSSVELHHEKIEGLMEPMIMEFNVANKAELEKLKVGDKVEFVLEFKNWRERIISIRKVK